MLNFNMGLPVTEHIFYKFEKRFTIRSGQRYSTFVQPTCVKNHIDMQELDTGFKNTKK